jgi:hypothetical protein
MLPPRNTSRLSVRPTDHTTSHSLLVSSRLNTTQADAAAEALGADIC